MNHSVKVSANGEVMLPAEVLQSLGVKPGDRVDFVPTSDGAFELRPLAPAPVDAPAQSVELRHLKGLFGTPDRTVDVDESISETIRRRSDPARSEQDP